MLVTFLGTSAGVPTINRGLPAIAVRRKGELLLFDCGEGTQRQMLAAKVGFCRKTKIFISHMHGDHVFGLLGLFQTMALLGRKKPLEVYGPRGIREFIETSVSIARLGNAYPIDVQEVDQFLVCQDKEFKIYAVQGNHTVQSFAYALVEEERLGRFFPEKANALGVPRGILWSKLQHGEAVKLTDDRVVSSREVMGPPRAGRKIVYSGDTGPAEAIEELARGADLLIHECTFDDEMLEWAVEERHSTASQAAEVARKACVRRLILTHVSARYSNPSILVEQAGKIFRDVLVAEDLMEIEVPYSE